MSKHISGQLLVKAVFVYSRSGDRA